MPISISVKENGRHSPDWSLQPDINGELTLHQLLSFTKGALLQISSDVLKEEQSQGFDQNPITIVDGKYNKSVQDVNPLGKIQFIARQDLREIILYAYEAVWYRSPRGAKGEYVTSNVVTLNGVTVGNDLNSVKRWLETAEFSDRDKVRILNTAPYARKLELQGVRFGRTSRKFGKPGKVGYQNVNSAGKVRKPNGAYALAAKAIKAKYGRNALIKFELISGSTIGLVGPGRVRKTGRDLGKPYVYPSILIYAVNASKPETGVVQ